MLVASIFGLKERQGSYVSFMLSHHSLTLKEGPKVKSDITQIYAAYDFRDISTFMLTRPSLTLKEWSKFKSDIRKRFVACSFPKVDCTLLTSSTNNKRDISTFMLTHFDINMTKSCLLGDLLFTQL